MAKTQWHPLFAELLKLLLRDYYEIQPEVPVSELPRRGDFLVVRRQEGAAPPFEALWSHLREYNVIEFKGMSDNADVDDLELLVHVGTGITIRLNEARAAGGQEKLTYPQVAFWYVAPLISDQFVGRATERSLARYQTGGVWRMEMWDHPVFLVSARNLPHEAEDSLPLLLLDDATAPTLGRVFAGKPELIKRLSSWLVHFRPDLWEEVSTVAEGLKVDYERIAELPDMEHLLDAMPSQRLLGAVLRKPPAGGRPAVAQIDDARKKQLADAVLATLSPEQAQQLLATLAPEGDAPTEEGKETAEPT